MEIGSADTAVADAHQDFAGGGFRRRNVAQSERVGFNPGGDAKTAGFHFVPGHMLHDFDSMRIVWRAV
jgi:hypothetical protein